MHGVSWSDGESRQGRRSSLSTEGNKAISNRVAQAISVGDLDALNELMAPEIAEEFKRDVTEIRRAFPDYAGTNVEQVANRFVFMGTHLGEFEGVTPTGKRVSSQAIPSTESPRARSWRAGSRWT